MSEVRIESNTKYLRWYSNFMVLMGLILLGGHLYQFVTDQLAGDWYMTFILGVLALIHGAGHLTGFIRQDAAEIVIDREGIRSNRSVWTSSFRWEKFQQVELHKNRIEVQYAESGLRNSLKIPFLIRFSPEKMQQLEKALSRQCEKQDVPFESRVQG